MTLVTFGETPLRIEPGGGRLRTARQFAVHADGTESTAAAAAAALGGASSWISRLPDTELGRRVAAEVGEHGVDPAVVWAAEGRQGLVFREPGARPREEYLLQDRTETAMASVEPGDLPMEEIRGASALFTAASTLALSEAAAGTVEAVFGAAQGTDVLAATDLEVVPGLCSAAEAGAALDRLGDSVDVLFANEDRVRSVLGATGDSRELVMSVASEADLELVVITRSERGALVLHDTPGSNVIHERAAPETDTVDPTGVHAAFVGAFLQRLVDGADAADALEHAVAAGALARTVRGPFLTVRRAEVERVAADVTDGSR